MIFFLLRIIFERIKTQKALHYLPLPDQKRLVEYRLKYVWVFTIRAYGL